MRSIFMAIAALMLMVSCAPLKTITAPDGISLTREGYSKDKNELFVYVHHWLIDTFDDPKMVIQYSDKEAGVVIGKCVMYGVLDHNTPTYFKEDGKHKLYMQIKMTIQVEDTKVKVALEPMGNSWSYYSSYGALYNYTADDALADMEELAATLFASLAQHL